MFVVISLLSVCRGEAGMLHRDSPDNTDLSVSSDVGQRLKGSTGSQSLFEETSLPKCPFDTVSV